MKYRGKNKFILTTSIFHPTEAVKKIARSQKWNFVVVGDKKTPKDWHVKGVTYLSPRAQTNLHYKTIGLLPWNLPARVMVGYLYAMEKGADIISQLDDDNIPYSTDWDVPAFDSTYSQATSKGFLNIYKLFTNDFVWPRGYPLDKIRAETRYTHKKSKSRVGVWQHLADGDTDVDAIYRLTRTGTARFKRRSPVVLTPNTACPFNCQSTTFRKEVFPLLYLPAFISPRESDIVRGLVAQPILWKAGFSLGFTAPPVFQKRNVHDYLKDFAGEMLIYLHAEEIYQTAKDVSQKNSSVSGNLLAVYSALKKKGLIPAKEIGLLKSWLHDVRRLSR